MFITFNNVKDALLTLLNVPFALIEEFALFITGNEFQYQRRNRTIMLFAICIQNGVSSYQCVQEVSGRDVLDDAIMKGVIICRETCHRHDCFNGCYRAAPLCSYSHRYWQRKKPLW